MTALPSFSWDDVEVDEDATDVFHRRLRAAAAAGAERLGRQRSRLSLVRWRGAAPLLLLKETEQWAEEAAGPEGEGLAGVAAVEAARAASAGEARADGDRVQECVAARHDGPSRALLLRYEPGLESLRAAAAGGGASLTGTSVRRVLRDVVRALRFLHGAAGVAHGDLHPGNVLCAGRPPTRALLIDLLEAAPLHRAAPLRTPLFAPPEALLRGAADEAPEAEGGGAAADVWALGVLSLQLLLGDAAAHPLLPPASPAPPSLWDFTAAVAEASRYRPSPQELIDASVGSVADAAARGFVGMCLRWEWRERASAAALMDSAYLAID